jgi:hypothetical protein
MWLPAKIWAALADPAVADELRRLEGEMSRLRRSVGNLLDMVEERVAGRSRNG